MVQLKLQITRPSFEAILRGEQKIESREVKPRNASRYVVEKELPDGSIEVTPKHIDALTIINGRRKDAPRLTVEVLGAESGGSIRMMTEMISRLKRTVRHSSGPRSGIILDESSQPKTARGIMFNP